MEAQTSCIVSDFLTEIPLRVNRCVILIADFECARLPELRSSVFIASVMSRGTLSQTAVVFYKKIITRV